MRLIDADTAEKKLAELVELYEKRMPKWSPNDMLTSGRDIALKHGYKADGVEKALETIKDMPTVEANPIINAQWEFVHYDPDYLIWAGTCTACKKKHESTDNVGKLPFCPHCGAQMNGEKMPVLIISGEEEQ